MLRVGCYLGDELSEMVQLPFDDVDGHEDIYTSVTVLLGGGL